MFFQKKKNTPTIDVRVQGDIFLFYNLELLLFYLAEQQNNRGAKGGRLVVEDFFRCTAGDLM